MVDDAIPELLTFADDDACPGAIGDVARIDAEGRFILTINEVPETRDLRWFRLEEARVTYMISGGAKMSMCELIVRSGRG